MMDSIKNMLSKDGQDPAESTDDTADQQTEKEETNAQEFKISYSRKRRRIPRLTPIGKDLMTNPQNDNRFDTIAYLIHCPRHKTIAIQEDKTNGFKWLPYTPLIPEKAWSESALIGSFVVLSETDQQFQSMKSGPSPFTSVQLLEIFRFQLPQSLAFLTRYMFYVKLKVDKGQECCKPIPSNSIIWVTLSDLVQTKVAKLWGPEVLQYARVINSDFDQFNEQIYEFSLDEIYKFSPRNPPRSSEEILLLNLNVSEKTIEVLYNDYLDHCYPSTALMVESFKHYMNKYGLGYNDLRLTQLFCAFNYDKTGYVTFHELLMGLAALEPNANHDDTRIKFVFRFYDIGKKFYLNRFDFTSMIKDIFPNLDDSELEAKMSECLEAVGEDNDGPDFKVKFEAFNDAIKSHKLRGTSRLVRSAVPVFLQLTRGLIHKNPLFTCELGKEWNDLKEIVVPRTHKGVCKKCRAHKPKLATHSVAIDTKTGYICKAKLLGALSNSAAPVYANSVEVVFNPESAPNVLINHIRQFNKSKGSVTEPRGLMDSPQKRPKMYSLVVKLFNMAEPILKAESRCPNINSPCIVIGDIHGNLEDLLTLEKTLWSHLPCLGPNFIFLGDYVDRGKWSLECALYLLSMKVLQPQKVILLRGNHEVRNLQEKYTYKQECMTKHGDDLGDKIWQMTNQLFELLPVAATVDNAIFCVHGGLSPKAPTLEHIRQMPSPLVNPEDECPIAWDILWSDPCHMQQYLDLMEDVNDTQYELAQQGFVFNRKRGAAYLFNERATSSFLARNGLSHMIRAHEVPPTGCAQHFNNLCTTVFSCSHYCSHDNEASVILLQNNRIRAVRIDTQNNAPATEK